ncbi:MAG: CHAT domain-containing protein [Planctomycetia bacterium]
MSGLKTVRHALIVALLLWPAPRAFPQGAEAGPIVLQPGLGGLPGGDTVPGPGYDQSLAALAMGDFAAALDIASREYRGGIRAGAVRWIDAIANAAVVGEAQFELGRFREAVAAYDEALLLAATHRDWLLAVQFPQQRLRPVPRDHEATWGRTQRNVVSAAIPDTISIRMGGADPQQVLKQGGVLTAPALYPIRPQEIMRALAMALYRRADILGELSREATALDEATKALAKRPAAPNHYSQSWIDVALGIAYWAQGKPQQAAPLLNRGLLVENQFDHPLTAWALIVLGRIALDSDQHAAAVKYFEEATFTAADQGDLRALEEAFRFAFAAHMAAGNPNVAGALANAAEWARGDFPSLRSRLLAMQAEAAAAAGNPRAAAKLLGEIDGRLMRGGLGQGACGAQAAYAAALAGYAAGDTSSGDADLSRALAIAQARSPRLFQTAILAESLLSGSSDISDRQADALFAKLLGDPSPRDFTADPLAALAAASGRRPESFETWVAVASRRGKEALLQAAEARLRARWLAAQPLGGRRTAIEALIAADANALPPADAARRAGLLARQQELARVIDEMNRGGAQLTASLLEKGKVPADAAAEPRAGDDAWAAYAKLAQRRGELVAAIAAGRDPTQFDFPPLTPMQEIQRRLPPRRLILSFHWTAAGLLGALESNAQSTTWQVQNPAAVAKEIAALAKAIGLVDAIGPVPTERLLESDWRPVAERLERLLFENSKVALGEQIDELVIVPDGPLWYLPFELLPVGSARNVAADDPTADADAPKAQLLRDVCRIRYCPTRSLAVLRFEAGRAGGAVGVRAGKMFRGLKPEAAQEAIDRLAQACERVVPIDGIGRTVPPAAVASLCESLVILDELTGDGPIAGRTLVAGIAAKGGVTFGDWLLPPRKRPRLVVLPGFQTAMAGGLAKMPPRAGDDLFFAATDLLAAGARSAVVSRWRTGGKLAVDLVEEFIRDVSVVPADDAVPPSVAESWHRAVELVGAEQPDPAREPRLKQSPGAVLPDARHPFFWAGYAVIDCGTGKYDDPPPQAQLPPQAKPLPQAQP